MDMICVLYTCVCVCVRVCLLTANGAIISEVNHDLRTVMEQQLKIVEYVYLLTSDPPPRPPSLPSTLSLLLLLTHDPPPRPPSLPSTLSLLLPYTTFTTIIALTSFTTLYCSYLPYCSYLISLPVIRRDPVEMMMSQEVGVVQRLSSPIVSTVVSTDSVSFQRYNQSPPFVYQQLVVCLFVCLLCVAVTDKRVGFGDFARTKSRQ